MTSGRAAFKRHETDSGIDIKETDKLPHLCDWQAAGLSQFPCKNSEVDNDILDRYLTICLYEKDRL